MPVGKEKLESQIDRVCLKCEKPFKAYGRFNRVCIPCRDANKDIGVFNTTLYWEDM